MAVELNRQKLSLVASSFLFRNVDEIVVERSVTDERCYQKKYEKGQVIFDRSRFNMCIGIVLTGQIQVNCCGQKELKMARIGPGDCFGAETMFHERDRYMMTLTALKPTEILFLPRELIMWLLQRSPVIMENYIAYLSGQIWLLNMKISGLTAGTAEQRTALYLLEEGGELDSMTELSQRLNMGRASLYRAMNDLEQQGLIRREGKTVELLDPDGLRRLVMA